MAEVELLVLFLIITLVAVKQILTMCIGNKLHFFGSVLMLKEIAVFVCDEMLFLFSF